MSGIFAQFDNERPCIDLVSDKGNILWNNVKERGERWDADKRNTQWESQISIMAFFSEAFIEMIRENIEPGDYMIITAVLEKTLTGTGYVSYSLEECAIEDIVS